MNLTKTEAMMIKAILAMLLPFVEEKGGMLYAIWGFISSIQKNDQNGLSLYKDLAVAQHQHRNNPAVNNWKED